MRAMRVLAALCALAVMGNAGTYTVRSGDTLDRIARKLGVRQSVLASANGIEDADLVRVGQVLTVPEGDGRATTRPAPPTSTHVVRKGDTLARIARTTGATVSELVRLNGLKNANRVRIGQTLVVPSSRVELRDVSGVCPVRGATRFDVAGNWFALRAGHRHMGNDIFAKRGTAVLANVGGTVTYANGSRAGLAYYLFGDDGHTYYGAHLGSFHAGPGRVERGQRIGTVGTTGNARLTPPHLHFEIKPRGGPPVDPYRALARWC